MSGLWHKFRTLWVPFLCPEDTLPWAKGSVKAASSTLLRGSPRPGLNGGLSTPVSSHPVVALLGSQGHRGVARVAGENVRDVEVKTLQDIRGLHLPREAGVRREQSRPPRLQPVPPRLGKVTSPRGAAFSLPSGRELCGRLYPRAGHRSGDPCCVSRAWHRVGLDRCLLTWGK